MIEWPDGTIDKGPTAESVLKQIADTQWNDYTPEQMREVLSDRTWKMRRAAVDPNLPLHDLFQQMEDAGMCWILQWEEEH